MVFDRSFIEKLSLFGLNSYESKLWAAILSRGVATAGELSELANVPRSRCYDVLESLEKKGFIVSKIGKPLKYIAVPPNEVLDRVKKSVMERAEIDNKKIDSLKKTEVMDELINLHKGGVEKVVPEDLSALLKGRKNLYNHISALMKDSKKSIYISTTETGLMRKYEKFVKDFKEASDRNVKIKIMAPISKNATKFVGELSKYAEIKHNESKSRFVVIDGKHLVFMFNDDENINPNYDMGVWVDSPFFSSGLHSMFEMSWSALK